MPGPSDREDRRLPGEEPGRISHASPTQRPEPEARDAGGDRGTITRATTAWILVAWGAVVVGASVALAIVGVPMWWLVLAIGAIVPLVLTAQQSRAPGPNRTAHSPAEKESELLRVLHERGEPSTPVMVALGTSLTVQEATVILEKLARQGHLKVSSEEGVLAYNLPAATERAVAVEPVPPTSYASQELAGQPMEPSGEPLSRRELEVLRLLASGRTNREIAGDLFVAVGTVKNHTNSIYRKLGARNRAGALYRARELHLLE